MEFSALHQGFRWETYQDSMLEAEWLAVSQL